MIPNKRFKSEQEVLLLTKDAVAIVKKVKELTEKRGDSKLFRWKDTSNHNRLVLCAEQELNMKIEGRGLHGFRRAFPEKLCDTDMNTF